MKNKKEKEINSFEVNPVEWYIINKPSHYEKTCIILILFKT